MVFKELLAYTGQLVDVEWSIAASMAAIHVSMVTGESLGLSVETPAVQGITRT